jgi:hypothetical protein
MTWASSLQGQYGCFESTGEQRVLVPTRLENGLRGRFMRFFLHEPDFGGLADLLQLAVMSMEGIYGHMTHD